MNGTSRTRRGAPSRRPRSQAGTERLAAADFKARCLALMNHVRETGAEYVITKHGRPVAKLVPYTGGPKQSLFGSMKGTVLRYERPFDPVDADYDVNRG
jgi:prevent-host-death family protein